MVTERQADDDLATHDGCHQYRKDRTFTRAMARITSGTACETELPNVEMIGGRIARARRRARSRPRKKAMQMPSAIDEKTVLPASRHAFASLRASDDRKYGSSKGLHTPNF